MGAVLEAGYYSLQIFSEAVQIYGSVGYGSGERRVLNNFIVSGIYVHCNLSYGRKVLQTTQTPCYNGVGRGRNETKKEYGFVILTGLSKLVK